MRCSLSEQRARCACAAIAVLLVFVCGCNLNPSRNDVVGSYVLKGQHGDQIMLTLSSDGLFSEKIRGSGNLKSTSGTWSVRDGNIDFDQLWIPPAFATPSIVQADQQAGARQPKYKEPGHWNLPVEKLWGRMKIEVFPDDDVEFVMVSRT
jgi:hypothetical protein